MQDDAPRNARSNRPRPLHEPPDAVECAVLQGIADGKSHAQIAWKMHYHEGAIGHIVADLARRHQVTTRQLLVLAGQRGWTTVSVAGADGAERGG